MGPYGWWHYCRTVTELGASITFWSTVPPPKVGGQVPQVFGAGEFTRVRRNIERLLADDVGPPDLGKEVQRLVTAIENNEVDDGRLVALRKMLSMVQVPEEKQLAFLADTFGGRFG